MSSSRRVGGPDGYERLVESYAGLVRATITRICGPAGAGLVEDVEQEVRIATYRFLESRKSIDHPYSFFVKVATRIAFRALKQADRYQGAAFRPIEDSEPVLDAVPTADRLPPDQQLEVRQLVEQGIASLTPRRRAAVRAYLEGMNHREIARVLGWSESSARNAIYDGLKALRAHLGSHGVTLS